MPFVYLLLVVSGLAALVVAAGLSLVAAAMVLAAVDSPSGRGEGSGGEGG